MSTASFLPTRKHQNSRENTPAIVHPSTRTQYRWSIRSTARTRRVCCRGITSRTKIYISLPCFGHRSGCKQFGNTYSTNRQNWRFRRRNSPSDKTTLQFVGPPSPACNVRRQLSCRELPVVVVLLVLLLEPLVIVGRIWALEAPAKERSGSGVSQEFSILLLQRYWTLEELWKLPKTMVSPPQKGRCPRW